MLLRMLICLIIGLIQAVYGAADGSRFDHCFTIMHTVVPGRQYCVPVTLDASKQDNPCFMVGFIESSTHDADVLQTVVTTLYKHALRLCPRNESRRVHVSYNNILINIYVYRHLKYMDRIPAIILPSYVERLLADIPQDDVDKRMKLLETNTHDDVNERIQLLQEQAYKIGIRHTASILEVDLKHLKNYLQERYAKDLH